MESLTASSHKLHQTSTYLHHTIQRYPPPTHTHTLITPIQGHTRTWGRVSTQSRTCSRTHLPFTLASSINLAAWTPWPLPRDTLSTLDRMPTCTRTHQSINQSINQSTYIQSSHQQLPATACVGLAPCHSLNDDAHPTPPQLLVAALPRTVAPSPSHAQCTRRLDTLNPNLNNTLRHEACVSYNWPESVPRQVKTPPPHTHT
jgi:hypothetical protein